MDVTTSAFDDLVVGRSHDVPVVVDFWAEWCGPCKSLAPVLEREVAARVGTVELAKVDVDANPDLAAQFNVSGIPAVKGFRDGRVVAEFVGALSPTAVSAWFDGLLAPPRADTLVEELRAAGELPDIVALLDAGDVDCALEHIVTVVSAADPETKGRLREVAVALFDRLGPDDPRVSSYRRRLSAALY